MRKRIRSLLMLLAVLGADLAWSPPAAAQSSGDAYKYAEMSPAQMKQLKQRQRLITFGVLGCAGVVVAAIVVLNVLDKKSARRREMELYAERMKQGVA